MKNLKWTLLKINLYRPELSIAPFMAEGGSSHIHNLAVIHTSLCWAALKHWWYMHDGPIMALVVQAGGNVLTFQHWTILNYIQHPWLDFNDFSPKLTVSSRTPILWSRGLSKSLCSPVTEGRQRQDWPHGRACLGCFSYLPIRYPDSLKFHCI